MEDIYSKMQTNSAIDVGFIGESEIQKFYANKTLLLTGCTSFLGKCIVVKLLRSCSQIKQLYLLVNPETGKTPTDFLNEYLEDTIFDGLRGQGENWAGKVVPIQGDLLKPALGISQQQRNLIIDTADVIIHNGAFVMFPSDNVTAELTGKVLGTQEMLDLAVECKSLKAFLYASTVYSACHAQNIEERIYDPPAGLKMIKDMIRADTETAAGLTKEALNDAFGQWMNISMFTASTAESLVEACAMRATFPCIVFRPAIMSATLKEPFAGWINDDNGPAAYIAAMAKGMAHTLLIRGNPVVDFVPADMAANALLATIWNSASMKGNSDARPLVYNYGSSVANPVSLKTVSQDIEQYSSEAPLAKTIWHSFHLEAKCCPHFLILHLLFHLLPAIFVDIYLWIVGEEKFAINACRTFRKHLRTGVHLANGDWRVSVDKMSKIWDRLNSADKELFYCDIRTLDWKGYFRIYWRGIRVHMLRDPIDTVEAARIKRGKLRIIHYALVSTILLVFLFSIFRIMT